MKATIYIPDDKYKVYEDARQKLGDSISAIFLRCLERELAQHKQTVGRIVVTINDNGTPCKKAFEGRWIWGSADEGQKVDLLADDKGGHYNVFGYSVAVTKARRVVVLEHALEDYPILTVFDDYEHFSEATIKRYSRFPELLKRAVASELEVDVENLDI